MKTLLKWSVEDYHRLIESGVLEGKSVELLAGEITVNQIITLINLALE